LLSSTSSSLPPSASSSVPEVRAPHCTIAFEGRLAFLLSPLQYKTGAFIVFRHYVSSAKTSSSKPLPSQAIHDTVLIEKELNILTLAEARANSEVCRKAMIDELRRWDAMKSWERMPRKDAKNLLDSRWVLKKKRVADAIVIKARLTARGFKDTDQSVSTFSATSTRTAQRLVVIIAVQYGFTLRSADVVPRL
jgi:hypothetical protein